MSAARASLATALSLAPPALAWAGGRGLAVEGAALTALALLPWLALAGAPQARGAGAGTVAAAAFALPAVALGAALDVRAGASPVDTALAGTIGLACCALLANAAARAARSTPRIHGAHAAAWTLVVATGPVLAAAVDLGGGPGAAPGWLGALARSSPIGWAASSVREIDLAPAWRALGACAALALAFARAPRADEVGP